MPEGYLHLTPALRGQALRATLPDLRAAEKRPYAIPYRAPNWRRSINDQPRTGPQQWCAGLLLPPGARAGVGPAPRRLQHAAQNDAGGGGGDRGKAGPTAVEPRAD